MKIIGVIPARLASTRLKEKVLADILGKPMIQHVYERAEKSKRLNAVLVACDHERILSAVHQFGGRAVLTSVDHPSGSDRIAEAVKHLKVDIVINIQGDEPLIDPSVIDRLADALIKNPKAVMATVIKKIEDKREIQYPNVVKVVIDEQSNALYFSRSAVPFCRDAKDASGAVYYKHLGIYAYRKKFLFTFKDLPKSRLEKLEKLEQLRVLEAGYKIKTVVTDKITMSVDTAQDLVRVKKYLQGKK